MKTSLQLFENAEFNQVRIVMRNGEPRFVAKDVAHVLGYIETDQAICKHCCHQELLTPPLNSKGCEYKLQKCYLIPESDRYRLIMRSKLPTAEKFKIKLAYDSSILKKYRRRPKRVRVF